MTLKLISCNVFLREACACVAQSPHRIDVEFTELGEHVRPEGLRGLLQERIDATEATGKPYDAILLLFGLCGNACVGLRAGKIPLVLPRAHDCCTILLGSRAKFKEHFGDQPSTPFSSVGYLERGEYFLRRESDGGMSVAYGDAYAKMVEEYGEEEAQYIWETMHPKHTGTAAETAVFIDLPETAHLGAEARFAAKAKEAGTPYKRLPGNIRLIQALIFGQWDAAEFLVIPPGQQTAGVYDFEEIVRAVK